MSVRNFQNWRAGHARWQSIGGRSFCSSMACSTATSRGQPALTAEYKLNLLSPAVGDRLICRARVIKPGRQVAVVAADVFCLTGGIEKHTATALASIAMLSGEAPAGIQSPA